MLIAVGSTNPMKAAAAKMAFEKVFPHEKIEIVGVAVASQVSDQPKSDQEALLGAKNRAQKALAATHADFGVGEEGGMHQIGTQWFETGWCIVVDKNGTVGTGSSIRMEVPKMLMQLIEEGQELGIATDIVFKTHNAKHKAGFFGLMSNGQVDRTRAYADGIISALTHFLHPDLF
ncbi:MAG TPA: inosine/xanthosine triphosphatase [Candidatus Saccharimonadales bacterium]|nr:inosine/xanthosine triphosphatase [Candidatus Saccharimonadales bacterium]